MKQRILALLLAAGLCLGLIAAAPALAFSDVSGEELSEAVEVLSGLGIGHSDGGTRGSGAGERLPHPVFRRAGRRLGRPLYQSGL